MSAFIDPQPGLYPNCVCNSRCEMPCWQRDGLDPDFDANDLTSCCCYSVVGERVFWHFDGTCIPRPGESVALPDGREGIVDTARGRKLTVIVRA